MFKCDLRWSRDLAHAKSRDYYCRVSKMQHLDCLETSSQDRRHWEPQKLEKDRPLQYLQIFIVHTFIHSFIVHSLCIRSLVNEFQYLHFCIIFGRLSRQQSYPMLPSPIRYPAI